MIINIFAVIGVLIFVFIVGYILLRFLIINLGYEFNKLEILVFSVLLTIPIIYVVAIAFSGFGIKLTGLNLSIFFLVLAGILIISTKKDIKTIKKNENENLINLPFIFVFLLTLILMVVTLYKNPLPFATDLSNHGYYIREVFFTHTLPNFHLPVFVIGENLIISIPSIIFNIDPLSIFPIIILFLFKMITILLIYLLAYKLFESKTVALLVMLTLGIFYSFGPPGTIYVYGGVIGNVIGDGLIMASLYILYRTLYESEKYFLFFLLFFFSLVYTHTLSLLILFFIIIFLLNLLVLFDRINTLYKIKMLTKFLKNRYFLFTLLLLLVISFIYLPTYISKENLEKITTEPIMELQKQKLDISYFKNVLGSLRFSLGILGLSMLLFSKQNKNIKIFFVSWLIPLLLLSWEKMTFIGLPQARVLNYMIYPFSILMIYPLCYLRIYKNSKKITIFYLFIILILIVGFSLPERALEENMPKERILNLYHASMYLKSLINENEVVLTEHQNSGFPDTWTRVFLLGGYNKVIERVYYFRYNNDPVKETWVMMTEPNSPKGLEYMQKNNVTYIIQNTQKVNSEFLKSRNFFKIYQGDTITIFSKK
ncbi:MAG TPA: hypothetical protein VJB89_00330 [Candidatus Nanoarchaeia archaeon]|nr:hypothetical protein [Candidatus Nanoarchaeia archaeon]